MVGVPVRQEQTLAAVAERLASNPDVLGALLIGSLASGAADAASDVDLIVCTRPGRFAPAWQRRHDLHAVDTLVCWDDRPEAAREVAVHRWVTADMVLVEALFAAPGSGVRLAAPWLLIAGSPSAASSLSPRPPVSRTEFDRNAAHPVDRAFDDLKQALRRCSGN